MRNLVFACIFLLLCDISSAQEKRYNILWLSTEDMSPWLACYGDKTAPTPNIDKLAREGIRFSNVFATTPVCAPARHTIITGMYATSTGALHMRNGSRSAANRGEGAYRDIPIYEAVPPADVRCFSEFFRGQGWYATNNSKQDYQFVAPPTAWDESSNRANWRERKPGQPFFSVFNCTWTHESQAFPNAEKRANDVKPADVKVPPYYPDTPVVRETLAQTYNNIVAMDKWLGEKLEALKEDGLLDQTVIFFFSDHGVGLPRGKRALYDSGLRVPLMVRMPDGKGAGTTDDRLISFLDFAPTALSLAGVKQPAYMRGTTFLGPQTPPPPPYVFATIDRVDNAPDMSRSVADGRYKYIRNFHPDKPVLQRTAYRENLAMMKELHALETNGQATPEQWQIAGKTKPPEEFYDTQSDPYEVKSLIDDPAQKDRIAQMRAALEQWQKDTKDLGEIQPETKLVKERIWPPDGVQPTTAAPRATLDNGKLTITCETEGASIGYRKKGDRSWSVYTAPVDVAAGESYEAIAHRIGFKPSEREPVKSQ